MTDVFKSRRKSGIISSIRTADLSVYKTVTKKESLQLDFIPVVLFPVTDLTGEHGDVSEIEDMKSQTDVLNAMNEDAIDSLKFEMFSMTALWQLSYPGGIIRHFMADWPVIISAKFLNLGDSRPRRT